MTYFYSTGRDIAPRPPPDTLLSTLIDTNTYVLHNPIGIDDILTYSFVESRD